MPNDMVMLMFNGANLLRDTWAGYKMSNAPPPIGLDSSDFSIKHVFNMFLEGVKSMLDFRFSR